ncbi:unnamed protein product [Moneuplotes crassus]|uniref:Uncharacterized protein n=1 Tax=Euplotes crassus TaxID=5936 RepID=A0AAD1XNJ3_EUPCR|nr:unnamed protein product [Moneuplotes crassus]
MAKRLLSLMVLAVLVTAVMCRKAYLSKFRSSPDLDVDKFVQLWDDNREKIDPVMQGLKVVVIGLRECLFPVREVVRFGSVVASLVLDIFGCDTLRCITPAVMLIKFFFEFRNFARDVITELYYGYFNLMFWYAKKVFGVVSKVVRQEGLEVYTENSDCIRMRIGQYFMPTFKGNDTSNCSQFDDIIISFSEQPIDPSLDLKPLLVKLSIIMILLILNFVAFKLLAREFKIFENQHQHLQTKQLILTPSKECISGTSSLHQELLAMHISPLKYPQIIEESDESCSFDSEPYSSLTSGARVRGSSAFILSDVASKGK